MTVHGVSLVSAQEEAADLPEAQRGTAPALQPAE
jgi:hypothetical protein